MDCLLRERELDNLRDKHKVQMGSANSSYEDNLRSGLNKRTEELDKQKDELKKAQTAHENIMGSLVENEQSLQIKKTDLTIHANEKNIRREERELFDKLEDLRKDCKDHYFGFLHELIQPIKDKFELPLKMGMKGKLNLLVVDTIKTATKVDQYLTEKGLYLDVLILEKIPDPVDIMKMRNKRQKLGMNGTMMIDIVSLSHPIPGLEKAVKFFCSD